MYNLGTGKPKWANTSLNEETCMGHGFATDEKFTDEYVYDVYVGKYNKHSSNNHDCNDGMETSESFDEFQCDF